MNEIFENNLKALGARKAKLAEMIRLAPASTIKVEEAKSGALTFKYEGIYFHSRYDPVKESVRLADEIKENGWDFTMIFGMGFGFLPRAIQEGGGGKLLIFEPSMDILRGVFESIDMIGIIEDTDIFITDSLWEVSAIIRAQVQPIDIIGVHVSISYKKFFMEELRSYTQAITNAQTSNRITMHTYKGSSEEWFVNYLKNVPNFFKFPPVDMLKDLFKGIPVFLVGAGPSLEKNAELLKKVKGRALIIAAITAYKPLVNFGVVPDFVIGIEKVDLAEYFTGGESDKEIRLMVGDISHENMFTDHGPKGIFIVFSEFIGASVELNALCGNRFQPRSGGSVTTAALDIAVFLGCGPIVFVGQDHAYGAHGSHVKGSVYGEQTMDFSEDGMVSVVGNYEGNDVNEVFDHHIHWLNGVDGKKVMSRYDWICFHQWIVDYVKFLKEEGAGTLMINSTEGGAYIDGMEHIPLAETIEKYVEPLEGGIDTVEKIISMAEALPCERDINGLIAEFEKTLFSFKTVQSVCDDSLKRMALIKKSYSSSKGLNESRKDILKLAANEDKLILLFKGLSFINEAAASVAYELQSHQKKKKLQNAEEQFLVDMGVTRNKNEAIVKLCRLFVPLFLDVLKELQGIKKSGGNG